MPFGIQTLKIVFFLNRDISVISAVQRETTLTTSDSTGEPVATEPSGSEYLDPQALVLMCLQCKSFENTVGKGDLARNEQFLLFPQCFQSVWRTFRHFDPV